MYDSPDVDERYTDQARVHIKIIGDDRLAPPVEEWFVTINTGGMTDRASLREALLEVLSPPNYELSERHNVVHWGAAGASYDLIIGIAGGAGGTIVGTQILGFLDRIRQDRDADPITEQDAIHEARWRVCLRYGYDVNFNDLSVVVIDNDFEHNRVTVTLADPRDNRYVVEVYRHNGRVTVARINHQPGESG
ncbi:hypothetical protein [Mycolicibacterium houstonense]|uniref:hypothetical protein n=1 Tax=Mycolicibacterium houstonense TaxID=146021 RepID=UPI003F98037E